MFPSECVLESRVRADGDADLAATKLPLFILKCEDRKAEGYAEDKLEIYNKMLKDMVVGVRLADAPPAVSYLAILGAQLLAEIVAVDKTVIVISLDFKAAGSPLSYLIYDAVALSLRMIPAPEDPSWAYTLSSTVSIASRGRDYALVHTSQLISGGEDSLFLWRPSYTSPPWSDFKKACLPYIIGWSETNTQFSFRGHAYWVDLLRGLLCCSCDAIFVVKNSNSMLKFIPLPVEPSIMLGDDQQIAEPSIMLGDEDDQQLAEPAAYLTMGVVRDSFIRFVSIDGFQDYVKLEKRTVTVWKLLGHDDRWEKEHELSLETLWGFDGFGDVPKHLTPMYPLLSTSNKDVVYLGLGEYRETKIVRPPNPPQWEFFPYYPCYMLAVDMRKKTVRTIVPIDPKVWLLGLVSCGISWFLHKALVGPCDDEGALIRMKKPKLG